jgi:hypothetical protein
MSVIVVCALAMLMSEDGTPVDRETRRERSVALGHHLQNDYLLQWTHPGDFYVTYSRECIFILLI